MMQKEQASIVVCGAGMGGRFRPPNRCAQIFLRALCEQGVDEKVCQRGLRRRTVMPLHHLLWRHTKFTFDNLEGSLPT